MSSLGPKQYDAFLSYNSQDRAAVEALARRLRDEGLRLYLEVWELAPGREIQSALTEGIGDSKSCVVFLGPNGLGPWQDQEVQVVINRRAYDGEYRVIPVLLPGFELPRPGEITRLAFLLNARWVEFFRTLDDEQALRELVWGIRGTAPEGPSGAPPVGECPYRGLEAFGPGDARLFFGRKKLTASLVSVLRRGVRTPQGARFLGVLGPSGSGKSSVALAGLVAWLKEGAIEGSARWPVAILRPGDDPLKSLTEKVVPLLRKEVRPDHSLSESREQKELLADLRADGEEAATEFDRYVGLKFSDEPDDRRLLIVVDQFEEIFTLRPQDDPVRPQDEQARARYDQARDAFLDNLLHAATVSGGRVAVVMTMRSDFLGACAPFEQLNAVLSAHQEQVGPMSTAELREAIERPAFLAGCGVEPALTERLLADVEGQPGALPLLQFALTETWKARDARGNLTLRAYEKLGENERGEQRGIKGVLDRRANEIYRDLPAKDQEVCKWLFLRLVQPGEGTEDTKRRASFGELVPAGSDAKSVESVISRLADARLITTWADPKDPGKTSVEVAHEALIRGWTQLRGWIDKDRDGLRLHRQLTEAAREWKEHTGDAGYLYQGARLAGAREWAEAHPQELNFGERKFLEAGVQHELYLKASQLVEAIRVAETKDVPPLVKQLADRRLWEAKKQLLDPIIMNSDGESKEHLHASLALLPEDDEQVEYLYHCLLKASPTELPVIRDALKQYQERLVERLWSVLEQPKDEGQYLQAASALALYDQSNPRWQNVGGKVAQAMVKVNVVYLRDWLDALHPARGELTAPLATIFRDKKHSETERSLAMNILADYASDQPTLLADLLMDSEENPFAALFDKLKTHQDLAVRPLEDELAKPSPAATEVDDQDVERKKDVLAERQARAAVALIRLGKAEEVWSLMRHSADPRLRSFLVNWLRPLGADPRTLAAELDRLDPNSKPMPAQGPQVMDAILFHPQTSMRRALILALGGYNPDELSTDKCEPLVEQLLEMYRNDPDAGIHGTAEWTLRRWKHDEKLAAIDVELKKLKDRGNRRWYVNSEGQTLAVIEGPIEFRMGSPPTEPERFSSEILHRRIIPRRFAIATQEVTVEQYQEFVKENPVGDHANNDRYSPDPKGPMNGVSWYHAAAYCNWLSRKENLPECYEPNDKGNYADGMKIRVDALQRTGYRLPTEAEWEYACRAGAMTSRYYGLSEELLGQYAWYLSNTFGDRARPCGTKLPNDLGLFDMLGNVYEWCQEQALVYRLDATGIINDDINKLEYIHETNPRLLRGGAFIDRPAGVRSAVRPGLAPSLRGTLFGFRPSRTYH